MKKSIVMFAVILAAGFASAYQYLYWMVDVSDQDEYEFSYATVSMGGTKLSLDDSDPTIVRYYANDYPDTGLMAGDEVDGEYANVGENDAYLGSTFLFELYSQSGSKIAYKSVAGKDLRDYIYTKQSGEVATPYKVSDMIPEPTSGLLMLLGMAGLALRRRRV